MAKQSVQGQWRVASASNAWSGRDGVGLLSLGENLFMMGGWNPTAYDPSTINEVWKSSNRGQTWARLADAPWEGRHSSAWLRFKNKLWVIGGDVNRGHYQRDVWSSPDGLAWTLETNSAPWASPGRILHCSFAHAGKMWVIGGQTLDEYASPPANKVGGPYYSDVWSSTDGRDWVKISENNTWGPRGAIIGGAVKDGYIWLVGGGSYDTLGLPRVYKNDVWRSIDGVSWELVSTGAFPARQYNGVVVLGGDIVLVAGWSGANRNDVFASRDGINWRELRGTPWAIRHAMAVCPHKGEVFVLGGPLTDSAVWALS